ncbi:transposase [Streptomyces sp. MK37H]|nr:transposase [Streptomyces sp. MK37H]
MIADKAYSSGGFLVYLRRRGIAHRLPEMTDQQRHRHHRGSRGGRPPAFDREIYRRRNTIERCLYATRRLVCCIPGSAGRHWRDIPGSDGSPGSERGSSQLGV